MLGVHQRKLLQRVVLTEFNVLDRTKLLGSFLTIPSGLLELIRTETDTVLVVIDLQQESSLLSKRTALVEQVHDVSDQLVYLGHFSVLGRPQRVLNRSVLFVLELQRFTLDLPRHLWILDNGIELRNDLMDQLLSFETGPGLSQILLIFEFLMHFYLAEVIFKKDDLDFVLLNLANTVQHFKRQNLNIRLPLQQKIQYLLVKGFAEEGVIADIYLADLHTSQAGQFAALTYFVGGYVQLFQKHKLLYILQRSQLVFVQIQMLYLAADKGRDCIHGSYILILETDTFTHDIRLFGQEGGQKHFSLGPHSIVNYNSPHITFQNRMTQPSKYYHNDYKKLMGLDQTRTKSQKLLDRAVGGFKNTQEPHIEKPPEKKVKQEHSLLTHREILDKITKNIDANFSAVKVLKPLNILRKCMNDESFVGDAQINIFEQWSALSNKLFQIDDKLVGNFSEISLVIECLVQIFQIILLCLRKLANFSVELKQQSKQQQQGQSQPQKQQIETKIADLIEACEMHLYYYKMYTDDSFTFNRILAEFRKRFHAHYSPKLTNNQPSNPNTYVMLQKLLIKMFNLPHTKYEWIRQSLTQFFKDFNIQFKHLLSQEQTSKYLKLYNQFISQKSTIKPAVDVPNIFGNGAKAGKVTSLQISSSDGLDKWTSKQ